MTSITCTKGCGKTFSRADARKRHERTCNDTKTPTAAPHVCPHGCGKTFASRYYLARHGDACLAKRNAKSRQCTRCTRCNAVFSRSDALNRHLRTCGVRFACGKGCGLDFATEGKQAAHEATCTYLPRTFWCPVCPWKGYVHREHYDWHAKKCQQLPPQDHPNTCAPS